MGRSETVMLRLCDSPLSGVKETVRPAILYSVTVSNVPEADV